MKRHVLALLLVGSTSLVTVGLGLGIAACSSGSSDDAANDTDSAAIDQNDVDADPCNTFTTVNKTCAIDPALVCFPQCDAGGCMCSGGLWKCVTDTTCFGDGSPLDFSDDASDYDAGPYVPPPPVDAGGDANDAGDSATTDGDTDADASDAAPADAATD